MGLFNLVLNCHTSVSNIIFICPKLRPFIATVSKTNQKLVKSSKFVGVKKLTTELHLAPNADIYILKNDDVLYAFKNIYHQINV